MLRVAGESGYEHDGVIEDTKEEEEKEKEVDAWWQVLYSTNALTRQRSS